MTIAFNSLFTRLGHLGHVGYTLAGAQAGLPTLLTTLFADYTGTADEDIIGNLMAAEDVVPQTAVAPASSVSSAASPTLIRMVQTDVPSITALPNAVVELIRQMRANSQTVKASAVTVASAALSTNTGSGTVVVTTKRGDGLVQENSVAEILRLLCSSDSYTGGQTAGQEIMTLKGAPQTAGLWSYNYPTGSNAASVTAAVSAATSSSPTSNALSNSNFETWSGTPNAASRWTIGGGGVWSTDVTQNTANPLNGTSCAEWVAGVNNTSIYEQFGDSSLGTAVDPVPLTSYAVNLWLRKKSGTITGGVLTVELVDGSGTVINDQQGVANSFTVTLSTLSTTYAAFNGTFRIPNVPPAVMRFRMRLSTALAGANFLMDDVCFAKMNPMYTGGPGYQVFSGGTPFVAGDGFNLTVTNDRGGSTYLATFQALFDRFFGMKSLGLLLPSTSGVATQLDTKITV